MLKKILIRSLLVVLIVLNLLMICNFSGEDAEKSGQTSEKVARPIAQTVVPDFNKKPTQEQNKIVSEFQHPIRKLAHMTEFGTLALWVLLLVRTWNRSPLLCGGIALLSAFLCAAGDELHQHLAKAGRAGRFTDVLIDTAGALIACLLFFGITYLFGRIRKKRIRKRKVKRA